MAIEGVDYAWGGPSPAALVAAGKKFVVRYGGPGSAGKQLTAGELERLRAAGIDVVANAEGAANGLRGTSAGKNWASSARDHFGGLGMPAGRPIYFSVDWDADSGDWADIDAALKGAASVIGAAQVGVYGSYDVMAHCRAAGTARWFWQTYAWSGGRSPASYVHLYQYRNGVTIGGADCDLTRALLPDYGQWGYRAQPQEEEVPDVNLTDKYGDAAYAGRTVQQRFQDDAKVRDVLWGDKTGTAAAKLPPSSPLAQLIAMPAQVAKLAAAVAALNPADFAAAVIAQLPDSADPISQDEVTRAVQEAFTRAFGAAS